MKKTWDVFVIGGGPAGLATAIAARQRGFDVAVADGMRPPIDKPCGEGLMPEACAALARLGVTVADSESYRFDGIHFFGNGLNVSGSFPRGRGMGVRRIALHRAMIARAESLGVQMLWQTPVTGLDKGGVILGREMIRARWVIGADGSNSRVRRWAGLEKASERRRFAFRRHYRVSPWNEKMELHWGEGYQVYVTPATPDEVCVAVAAREPRMRLEAAIEAFPEIASRLHGAKCTSAERGAVSSTRRLRRIHRGRVALVGDASGGVDCITGEGLGLAFRQAELLAECLLRDDLRAYQKQHAALARRPTLMSQLLLALDARPGLRQRAMRVFQTDAGLFGRMVAMHVGALPVREFVESGFSLGWKMLRA
jgi:menaquinone-9 beta-reductase